MYVDSLSRWEWIVELRPARTGTKHRCGHCSPSELRPARTWTKHSGIAHLLNWDQAVPEPNTGVGTAHLQNWDQPGPEPNTGVGTAQLLNWDQPGLEPNTGMGTAHLLNWEPVPEPNTGVGIAHLQSWDQPVPEPNTGAGIAHHHKASKTPWPMAGLFLCCFYKVAKVTLLMSSVKTQLDPFKVWKSVWKQKDFCLFPMLIRNWVYQKTKLR